MKNLAYFKVASNNILLIYKIYCSISLPSKSTFSFRFFLPNLLLLIKFCLWIPTPSLPNKFLSWTNRIFLIMDSFINCYLWFSYWLFVCMCFFVCVCVYNCLCIIFTIRNSIGYYGPKSQMHTFQTQNMYTNHKF